MTDSAPAAPSLAPATASARGGLRRVAITGMGTINALGHDVPATLAAFPHRLIDLISPEEAYSAARFCA